MSIQSKIDEFEELERGWDGYNAPPIPKRVIDLAREAAERFGDKEGVEVFPTGRESVQFEFDDKEIEIFGDRSVGVLVEKDGECVERTCTFAQALRQYDSDEYLRAVACDECGEKAQVDISDLDDPPQKAVARRAGFAVSGDEVLCPMCWDAVNPMA